MIVCRCGLIPSPPRRGRNKGRCDACSAGVPPAMVVYRCGLVLSPTRRGCCKGCCDACSAGVPPAMVVYRCGLVSSPPRRDRCKGCCDVCSAGVPAGDGGVPMRVGSITHETWSLQRALLWFRAMPSAPAFWAAVTLWRPGGPASHHRRGRALVAWEGCDHADGAPAAFLVAWTADCIALPREPGSAIVRGAGRSRMVVPAQWRTRHPEGAGFSACPDRLWFQVHTRFGGHCGGGLPACPSVLLKLVGRIRESAGRSGLVGFPAAVTATGRATGFYWHRPSGPP